MIDIDAKVNRKSIFRAIMPANIYSEELKIKPHCIITGSTVTTLCDADPKAVGDMKKCDIGKGERIAAIADNYKSISGTLTTTNIIMANWSTNMWQAVLNRAVRMLAFGVFGTHFVAAVGTLS
ncbi:hypothetical protein KIN20_032923 [Parelaphostrongylus tenuis]|uniref:Uncharacterized protein n=1 Tax=Parelaphostrongylus tenuis TaxID=148309 RepID=A0AAD5R774_PARTN|nr:hypothetical protein KIN20_032923 [Parelaphostrongylus tenuis]